jgi:nucleotide-binding universal stress UspA family protein
MGLQGPVLAATDLSEAADAAIRQARDIARALDTPFIVGHVLPEAFRVRVLFPQDAGVDDTTQRELGEHARAAVAARIASLDAGAPQLEIESGSPHAGILAIAERVGARLIVMGPGTAARHVARAVDVPVLIARPSPAGGGVLGATDFSDPAFPAIRMAADEATRRGVRLRLLHCLTIDLTGAADGAGLPGFVPFTPIPPQVVNDLEAAARLRLADLALAIGAVSEAVVAIGRPPAAIVEAATGMATALVVVGTRGRSGLARLALGSVAERVINDAPCSVLVVPLHPGSPAPPD